MKGLTQFGIPPVNFDCSGSVLVNTLIWRTIASNACRTQQAIWKSSMSFHH